MCPKNLINLYLLDLEIQPRYFFQGYLQQLDLSFANELPDLDEAELAAIE